MLERLSTPWPKWLQQGQVMEGPMELGVLWPERWTGICLSSLKIPVPRMWNRSAKKELVILWALHLRQFSPFDLSRRSWQSGFAAAEEDRACDGSNWKRSSPWVGIWIADVREYQQFNNQHQNTNKYESFPGPRINLCIWNRIRSTNPAIHVSQRDRCEWNESDNSQGSSSSKHASSCQRRRRQSQRLWVAAQSSAPNPGCKKAIWNPFTQLMSRSSTCSRVTAIHLHRTRSPEPCTFPNHWPQPRSSWIRWWEPPDLLFKWSSLGWTQQPKKGISVFLFKAGKCSKVRKPNKNSF